MSVKNELIDFSDMSGGKNSAFPKHAIAKNQVSDTINALHEAIGISYAPGYLGVDVTYYSTYDEIQDSISSLYDEIQDTVNAVDEIQVTT